MLTLRDHQSEDLFDPWEYLGPQRRKLLEQGWAGVFRDYLLHHLPVKQLAASFRDDFGRPAPHFSNAVNIDELFTINRLGVPGPLRRCLATTNLIDSTHWRSTSEDTPRDPLAERQHGQPMGSRCVRRNGEELPTDHGLPASVDAQCPRPVTRSAKG